MAGDVGAGAVGEPARVARRARRRSCRARCDGRRRAPGDRSRHIERGPSGDRRLPVIADAAASGSPPPATPAATARELGRRRTRSTRRGCTGPSTATPTRSPRSIRSGRRPRRARRRPIPSSPHVRPRAFRRRRTARPAHSHRPRSPAWVSIADVTITSAVAEIAGVRGRSRRGRRRHRTPRHRAPRRPSSTPHR